MSLKMRVYWCDDYKDERMLCYHVLRVDLTC